jgi:hypothetical protein
MKDQLAIRLFSRQELAEAIAERQIAVLSNGGGGLMRPDKCSRFEPIQTPFDPSKIDEAVTWLSAPAGTFMYRKGRPANVTGVMWNRSNPELWERDTRGKPIRRISPRFPPPLFINYWTADFDSKWAVSIGLEKVVDLAIEMFEASGSDFGLLTALADLNAKNIDQGETGASISYQGLDPANGLPGLYWINLFSAPLASWLKLRELPQNLAKMKSVGRSGVLLQFGTSPSECSGGEVLDQQREVIERLGPQRFFDIRSPDGKLDAPPWNDLPHPMSSSKGESTHRS